LYQLFDLFDQITQTEPRSYTCIHL